MRPARGFGLFACLLILTGSLGCGGESGTGPPLAAGVKYIDIGMNLVLASRGTQFALVPTAYDSNAALLLVPPSAFQFTTETPNMVELNGRIVRVLPNATLGRKGLVKVSLGSAFSYLEIFVSAAADSITLSPGSTTLTPGATVPILGIVWVQGIGEGYHYITFATTDSSVAWPRPHACGIHTDCIPSPDVTHLLTGRPGTAVITTSAEGHTTVDTVEVRQVSFDPATVTAGSTHTCAYTTDQVLFCWGSGFAVTPMGLRLPGVIREVQAGDAETCGLDASDKVVCWANDPHPVPVPLTSPQSFSHLAVGAGSSCGLDAAGAAWCWGANDAGQLGDGSTTSSAAPVAVVGGLTFDRVSTYGTHTCGLTATGAAWCWGSNTAGQLGAPVPGNSCQSGSCSSAPLAVTGGHTFVSIGVGTAYSCGLDDAGSAWCWGSVQNTGSGGQVPANSYDPVAVAGGHTWSRISVGPYHACGLTTAGEGYCWGANPEGRTGQNPITRTDVVLTPRTIVGGHQFTMIVTGLKHTCATAQDGLYCFGDNVDGQIGAEVADTRTPVKVNGQP